jgi:DNA topoisomerase-1
MKKKLLVVESPAKIKTIKKFLGDDFEIMSTVGHIMDLPKRKLGITINDGIEIEYVIMDDKEKVIAGLAKAASTADEIFLAPDPDREGEIIAWHVANQIGKVVKNKKSIHRISFNEITKTAIEEAIKNPHEIDLHKVSAQQARRVLDRWVGYEVSPILWKKISTGLSAGRVQSVALKLICTREEAIRGFKPEEYWSITSTFTAGRSNLVAALATIDNKKAEIKDEATATKIVTDIKKQSFNVDSIKDSKRLKNPLPPFMTSTLQQAAFNRLGIQAQRTMQLAQKLYEGVPLQDKSSPVALITYMRTDSLRIADIAIKDSRKYIEKEYGKEYLPGSANAYSKKGKAAAQDAHEAIRPIDVNVTPQMVKPYLDASMYKLYTLIWQRFVACQMKPAEYAQRQVSIVGGPYVFKVTGSTLLFDGFLKVYAEDAEETEEKVTIPKTLKENTELPLKKIDPKQHFTQPPPRYTEASLIKEMEKEGIGRPSTYTSILRTIQARSYTQLDERKRLVPSELGMAVVKLLQENLPDIMDISFTAQMEEKLDQIAQGELDRDKLLKGFYKNFSKDLKKFGGDKTERPSEETKVKCPDCKKNKLLIKFGKAGAFLGCPDYPDCKFTSNFERQEDGTIKIIKKVEPKKLKEKCPKCDSHLIERIGRYGPFTACSNYPKCKYIKQEAAKFKCITCKTGDMNKRTFRGSVFWGCSNYPECKTTIPGEIEEIPCKSCKRPYMLKRISADGAERLVCHNKECKTNEKKK